MNDIFDWTRQVRNWVSARVRKTGGAIEELRSPTDDYQMWRDQLRGRVAGGIKRLVKNPKSVRDKVLVICLSQDAVYEQARQQGLDSYLRTYIELSLRYQFSDVILQPGRAETHDVAVAVGPEVDMAVRPAAPARTGARAPAEPERIYYPAVVSIHKGNGSLYQDKVRLVPKAGQRYNIGAGKDVVIDGSIVRENQIAIRIESEDEKFKDFNKYVSRAHAHIVFKAGQGWKLYAEERGIPENGKTTELSRDSRSHGLTHTGVGYRLRDGDCIVLNQHVILSFKEDKRTDTCITV